jgi:small subunit ribosomal protein S2
MLDLREMLKAGVHFGHKTSRWCPKMRPYIWGSKNKIHLIDVSKTALLLEKIGGIIKEVSSQGGVFLFVGTKKAAQPIIEKAAKETKTPYVINRWVGGTLSNFEQVKKAITRLLHLRDVAEKSVGYYKKKEIVMFQKEIARLEKNVGGIIDFTFPPAALIVVDAKKERAAVKEASALGIPVIAIVDTNTDPEGVTHVIPANDDSPKSIQLLVDYLASQIKEGQKIYAENRPVAPVRVKDESLSHRDAHPRARDERDGDRQPRRHFDKKPSFAPRPAAPSHVLKAAGDAKVVKTEIEKPVVEVAKVEVVAKPETKSKIEVVAKPEVAKVEVVAKSETKPEIEIVKTEAEKE